MFAGTTSGSTIIEGVIRLGTALSVPSPRLVDAHALLFLEELLSPISSIITSPDVAAAPPPDRLNTVLSKIESCRISAKANVSHSTSASDSTGGDKSSASGKMLLAQLAKPESIELIQRLNDYRRSPEYDPKTYLEMAHSGRMTPELRAVAEKAAAAINKLTEPARHTAARAAIEKDDKRAPIPALMQLAWGQVKTLEGYPELQDIYDLGQTHMPDVLARVVARAFSADNMSVPLPLRFARATQLHIACKGRSWETDLDLINDADACMLSYIEGGQGTEIHRIPSHHLYTDISQVLRCKRIGANLGLFFGVRDGATGSWRQLVASCEHAFMSIPASDDVKRARLGKAMRRLITRSWGDLGKRIDLVRYASKADAVVPRDMLTAGVGGPQEEFAESVARIADDQKRKRSQVADDQASMQLVCLPFEIAGCGFSTQQEAKRRSTVTINTPDTAAAAAAAAKAAGTALVNATIDKQPTGTGTEWTTLSLAVKHVPGAVKKVDNISVRVNAAGATRWLKEHGVHNPCLAFQFGRAGKNTRQFASCTSKRAEGHTEEMAGPHAAAEGWHQAASRFVHPQDKAKFNA